MDDQPLFIMMPKCSCCVADCSMSNAEQYLIAGTYLIYECSLLILFCLHPVKIRKFYFSCSRQKTWSWLFQVPNLRVQWARKLNNHLLVTNCNFLLQNTLTTEHAEVVASCLESCNEWVEWIIVYHLWLHCYITRWYRLHLTLFCDDTNGSWFIHSISQAMLKQTFSVINEL